MAGRRDGNGIESTSDLRTTIGRTPTKDLFRTRVSVKNRNGLHTSRPCIVKHASYGTTKGVDKTTMCRDGNNFVSNGLVKNSQVCTDIVLHGPSCLEKISSNTARTLHWTLIPVSGKTKSHNRSFAAKSGSIERPRNAPSMYDLDRRCPGVWVVVCSRQFYISECGYHSITNTEVHRKVLTSTTTVCFDS